MDGTQVAASLPRVIPGRPARPRRPAPAWQQATVVEIINEAPDAVTLRLRLSVVDGFVAGQYYNVRMAVPGRPRPIQRAYSIGSAPVPDPSIIDIGVKEVPGGLLSPRLVREMGVGHELDVRGPHGSFVWDDTGTGSVLLVGAGSGLVPLMSMVRYARETQCGRPVWIVCSATTYDHAFYREELAEIASSEPWLRVVHCITRDPDEPRADYHRRIDADVLAETLGGETPDVAYLCGPPAMCEDVEAHLEALGIDPARIRTEKFD